MRLTFALKPFFTDGKLKSQQVNHFLLRNAKLEVTLVFEDSTEKIFAPPRDSNGQFKLDLGANEIPDMSTLAAVGEKKRIARLALDFWVPLQYQGKTFQLLKIRQDFSLRPKPTNTDLNIDYALSPFSWRHSATSAIRTANRNVHPLLDLTKLSQNIVMMNALMLDLTELWDLLHEENENYQFYKEATAPGKVTFKVFAHLGGNPFIWYSVVPAYLSTSTTISPHIFYFAGDYGAKQNLPDEEKYLFDNPAQSESRFLTDEEASERRRRLRRVPQRDEISPESPYNGRTLLLGYLLPPVDDDKIRVLKPKKMDKDRFQSILDTRRNVVGFERSNEDARQIALLHWNIGAGLEKAFYGLGKTKPQQFLLLPQPYGKGGQAVKGLVREPHIRNVTGAIIDLMQSNTELIGRKDDNVVAKDKLVLSAYSESGLDLWRSCNNNIDHIKAIIGIEPNSVNPLGTKVIPKLLDRKIRVFIIGRHKTHKPKERWKYHYRPEIPEKRQSEIDYLPKNLDVLKYRPVPASNDFVRLRVARVTDPASDEFMNEDEQLILEDLAGKDVMREVFSDLSNQDERRFGSVVGVMYTHNFALTGGEEMTFETRDKIYGSPVSYRTFFQQAVEEIG